MQCITQTIRDSCLSTVASSPFAAGQTQILPFSDDFPVRLTAQLSSDTLGFMKKAVYFSYIRLLPSSVRCDTDSGAIPFLPALLSTKRVLIKTTIALMFVIISWE